MPGALEGIRVLDLSRTIAGPFCTMLLGDMGAEVVKVEEPDHGDETREWPAFWNGHGGVFLAFNRNKRSLTLNLKHPQARAVAVRAAIAFFKQPSGVSLAGFADTRGNSSSVLESRKSTGVLQRAPRHASATW